VYGVFILQVFVHEFMKNLNLCSLFVLIAVISVAASPEAASFDEPRIRTVLVTDEADAVLGLLSKLEKNLTITDEDWKGVFATAGYMRLKEREVSMGRSFEERGFKAFVLSGDLRKQYRVLAQTLEKWKAVDVKRSGRLALAYLPKNAMIRAKIYPVIKPRDNSFVFDLDNDPAIFLYLDPKKSPEDLANTIAHELHHIGFGTACPEPATAAAIKELPENTRKTLRWMGAFGEGFAMLAASGGPDHHPHEYSLSEDKVRWDNDVKNFDADRRRVETFFLDLISGKLSDEKEIETARSFYGIQGPWYTVGWKMAVTIEKALGRDRLIDCFCDQRKLFSTFNEAVKKGEKGIAENLGTWDASLIERLK
jgi:hypothetical protein